MYEIRGTVKGLRSADQWKVISESDWHGFSVRVSSIRLVRKSVSTLFSKMCENLQSSIPCVPSFYYN